MAKDGNGLLVETTHLAYEGSMSEMVHGASGIPMQGREAQYATELWLDGPSAFWLHPEGPLSDTTVEEWRGKQPQVGLHGMDKHSNAGLLSNALANSRTTFTNCTAHNMQQGVYMNSASTHIYDCYLNAAAGGLLRFYG